MRWVFFAILVWVLVLIQTTIGKVLTFETRAIGTVGPDLLAAVAVFIALYVRGSADVMIAACVLGFVLDIASAGGPGSAAVIGPMPIAYCLAARMLFEIREAFFRQSIPAQVFLSLLFCLTAHGLWVTGQSILAAGAMTWSEYGRMLCQAAAVSCYTAALTPLVFWLLAKLRRRLIPVSAEMSRRGRR